MKINRLIKLSFLANFIFALVIVSYAQNNDKEFYEKYRDKKISVSFQNTDIDELFVMKM